MIIVGLPSLSLPFYLTLAFFTFSTFHFPHFARLLRTGTALHCSPPHRCTTFLVTLLNPAPTALLCPTYIDLPPPPRFHNSLTHSLPHSPTHPLTTHQLTPFICH